MHPLLISQIAQDEVAERIRTVERERLALASRSAGGRRRPSARMHLLRLVRGVAARRRTWTGNVPVLQGGPSEPCPEGECS